jgi:hypothetical protein
MRKLKVLFLVVIPDPRNKVTIDDSPGVIAK